jgi:hypothetical protein
MPGVFRDPSTGTYRYYSYNDYEERRHRDWDDQQQGRTPFGPPRWEPAPPPPSIGFGPDPAYDPPDTSVILAVINADQMPPTDNTWFDRLVESLPKSVGEKPAFDALVENPQVTTVDYRTALEVLEAASG